MSRGRDRDAVNEDEEVQMTHSAQVGEQHETEAKNADPMTSDEHPNRLSTGAALVDEESRDLRGERITAVSNEAVAQFGASDGPETPAEGGGPILAPENRPGLGKPIPNQDIPVVEQNPVILAQIQDPYNERVQTPVPMVMTRDSYGNAVPMPV